MITIPSQTIIDMDSNILIPSQIITIPSQSIRLPIDLTSNILIPSQQIIIPSQYIIDSGVNNFTIPSQNIIIPSHSNIITNQAITIPSQSNIMPSQNIIIQSLSNIIQTYDYDKYDDKVEEYEDQLLELNKNINYLELENYKLKNINTFQRNILEQVEEKLIEY
jgi:hypothetical protein